MGEPLSHLSGPEVRDCGVCGSPFEVGTSCGCLKALERFHDLMIVELQANADKGGRMAWLMAHPDALLAEVHDHAAKLHVAARELVRRNQGHEPRPMPWGNRAPLEMVHEFAADTANMALMLVDRLEQLEAEG